MHQVLPLPDTSIFHPKNSSKYFEVSEVHRYLSVTNKGTQQLNNRAKSQRQSTEQETKPRSTEARDLLKSKRYGFLLKLFCLQPSLIKRKIHKQSYLLPKHNYWWCFCCGTQTDQCSPCCKVKAQKSAVGHGRRQVAKHSLKWSRISLSQPSGCL